LATDSLLISFPGSAWERISKKGSASIFSLDGCNGLIFPALPGNTYPEARPRFSPKNHPIKRQIFTIALPPGKAQNIYRHGPGVGKTFQMLKEGHRLKSESIDVVIRLLETRGRKETAAKGEKLEIVPKNKCCAAKKKISTKSIQMLSYNAAIN